MDEAWVLVRLYPVAFPVGMSPQLPIPGIPSHERLHACMLLLGDNSKPPGH